MRSERRPPDDPDPFGMAWVPPLRGWKGEALRRRGPNEFRIVTRMPNGIRVTIPLGRFRGGTTEPS